jgi:hypothetical protein
MRSSYAFRVPCEGLAGRQRKGARTRVDRMRTFQFPHGRSIFGGVLVMSTRNPAAVRASRVSVSRSVLMPATGEVTSGKSPTSVVDMDSTRDRIGCSCFNGSTMIET